MHLVDVNHIQLIQECGAERSDREICVQRPIAAGDDADTIIRVGQRRRAGTLWTQRHR